MAISDDNNRLQLLGLVAVLKLYLGIRAGARYSVAEYRRLKDENPTLALGHLRRAIDMPNRARAQFDEAAAEYGQEVVSAALAWLSSTALQEMNADVNALLAQAQTLATQYTSASRTKDQIATSIENNLVAALPAWRLKFPTNYTDIFGNSVPGLG